MNIHTLELLSADLLAQRDFYGDVLEVPSDLGSSGLLVQGGKTDLLFKQAPAGFEGAYHFAFNIPENQFQSAKKWLTSRTSLLHDKSGKEDFESKSWNSDSICFLDAAGNVLEFIARHTLQNAAEGNFSGARARRTVIPDPSSKAPL